MNRAAPQLVPACLFLSPPGSDPDGVDVEIFAPEAADHGADLVRVAGGEQAEEPCRAVAARARLVEELPRAARDGGAAVHEGHAFAEGATVPGIGRAPEFNNAAFALDDGQVSDLVEEADAVYILEPFERKGPQVPPLGEIRERVMADARRAAGEAAAKEQADKLLARAREVGLPEAAKEAGLYDEALALASRTPCDPKTLTRAARDHAETQPAFAVGAGLLALQWLVHGYGYEITGADVWAAYTWTMKAAERTGAVVEIRGRVQKLVAGEAPGGFVSKILGRELGL